MRVDDAGARAQQKIFATQQNVALPIARRLSDSEVMIDGTVAAADAAPGPGLKRIPDKKLGDGDCVLQRQT
jgi:hypothetical protein